ncbi:MAG: hypothetical protein CVU16_13210 [Betaproteobacteria bacterium HGW-Betaproteobacteria-10]|nr:MAG: hypothetical protein CVU16_13210 [Betaproteobacteria bacterium HGW-Betaproteobacteria-10]
MHAGLNEVTLPAQGWMPTLQSALREATRQQHHRLDHHPLLARLVRPGLQMADYGRALQALYAINAPSERCIADYIAAQGYAFDYAAHQRMPDLLADLAYLSLPVPPLAWAGPRLDSPGELVGCLYVLAGSTLGGRVIFRQLQSVLPVTASAGARFFAGHGEQTMGMWQNFWAFAATICSPAELPAARQSAAALFERILTLLESQSC